MEIALYTVEAEHKLLDGFRLEGTVQRRIGTGYRRGQLAGGNDFSRLAQR